MTSSAARAARPASMSEPVASSRFLRFIFLSSPLCDAGLSWTQASCHTCVQHCCREEWMKHVLVGLAAVVLAASPAAAQERPMFAPSRDVTIDYTIDAKGAAPNQPRTVQMEISAGGA